MSDEELTAVIQSLTPEEQASVLEFIQFLRSRVPQQEDRFRAAIDEFMDQHPELLRRLAQ